MNQILDARPEALLPLPCEITISKNKLVCHLESVMMLIIIYHNDCKRNDLVPPHSARSRLEHKMKSRVEPTPPASRPAMAATPCCVAAAL